MFWCILYQSGANISTSTKQTNIILHNFKGAKIKKPDICDTIISVSELLESFDGDNTDLLGLADAKKNEMLTQQTDKIDELQKLIEQQKEEKEKEIADKQEKVLHESKKFEERIMKSKKAFEKINNYIETKF